MSAEELRRIDNEIELARAVVRVVELASVPGALRARLVRVAQGYIAELEADRERVSSPRES